jgi:hypothetical protein
MNTCTENRLIPTRLVFGTPLGEKLSKKWVIDYGYTNSLGEDCALLICKTSEL